MYCARNSLRVYVSPPAIGIDIRSMSHLVTKLTGMPFRIKNTEWHSRKHTRLTASILPGLPVTVRVSDLSYVGGPKCSDKQLIDNDNRNVIFKDIWHGDPGFGSDADDEMNDLPVDLPPLTFNKQTPVKRARSLILNFVAACLSEFQCVLWQIAYH